MLNKNYPMTNHCCTTHVERKGKWVYVCNVCGADVSEDIILTAPAGSLVEDQELRDEKAQLINK